MAGTVARIDPTAGRVTTRIRLGSTPRGVALGAGRVWVRDVAIISSSAGGLPLENLFDNAGDAARGILVTAPEFPPDALGAAGERFERHFGGPLPGDFVARWAFYGAAAAEVMLDAIARSDGTRESVAGALGRTRDVETPLGRISLDALGERTTHPVPVLRAERRAVSLEPVLTDVLTSPARLVGRSPDRPADD
jgi:hypothetical protein